MTENELSYKIIGAALEVHRNLGVGFIREYLRNCPSL